MTNIPDRHAFTPSRSDGTVCVATRPIPMLVDGVEACGYPAAHPIHGPYEIDLSPRPAPMRTDADDLRVNLWALVEHARQAPPGTPELAARVHEIVKRWGAAR